MPLILGTNSIKATGFDVDNSVRLDNNAYFSRTFDETGAGAGGGTYKWTLSIWFKRSLIDGNEHVLMSRYVNANKYVTIKINGNNKIEYRVYNFANQCRMTTTAVFRDIAAWTHFVIAQDTSDGTAGDRTKFFINGSRVTAFDTQTNFNQNVGGDFNTAAAHQLGAYNGGDEFQGYFAQVCFVDNAQYDADQFGEFDSDSPTIWKPKDVSGLSTGASSFFLDFADSGDLGDDESGNTNDWTENNIDATDQSIDTCTNNFCVMNALENYYQAATLTDGNLKLLTATSSNVAPSLATVGLTAGKWYYEAKYVSDSLAASSGAVGIVGTQILGATNSGMLETAQKYGLYLNDGDIWYNNSKVQELGAHIDHTATIGIALDFDNNRITFSVDGGWGDGSGNWDESSPHTYYTVAAPSAVDFGAYFPAFGDWSSGSIGYEINFGSPIYSISSGNQDANGYGNFEYAVPSGYFSICTKNLAEYGG